MSLSQTRSVLAGGPRTRKKLYAGETSISVQVRALPPFFAKVADYATLLLTAMLAIGLFTGAILIPDASHAQRLIMCVLPVPAYFVIKAASYHLLSLTKPVRFENETIAFRSWFRMKRFDSNVGIKFVLHDHPRTRIEENKMELRETKRKIRWYTRPLKPYYQDAKIISLEYMGQRNDICACYRIQEAQKIVARLTAAQDVIAGYGRTGRGTALTPAQQWDVQAGGLQRDAGGLS